MKKFVISFTMILFVLCLAAYAETEAPSFELTYVPELGETACFEGIVTVGEDADPSDYIVNMYLQLYENGDLWIKPTYAMPYVKVDADGHFSLNYATGGNDIDAQYLHLFLLPADCIPDGDFNHTQADALDYILVTRLPGQDITVKDMMHDDIGTGKLLLEDIPVYGSDADFTGTVLLGEDSGNDFLDYRISLYLQLQPGDTCWPKPTYETPYAIVEPDGSFSISYATGSRDDEATVIHILLIPASYTPDGDFEATKAVALDYVQVTRQPDGTIHVDPMFD